MNREEWLKWVKAEFGSWRYWATLKVATNWRIRKRLPLITAKARKDGLID